MKKLFAALLAVVLVFCVAGCGSSEPDLYEIGIDITGTMSYMIDYTEYGTILSSTDFDAVRKEVDANDYSSPIAVYSVTLPGMDVLLKEFDENDARIYNALPEPLKEQIANNFSLSSLIGSINTLQSTEKAAFSSVYTARKDIEDLKLDGEVNYVFVFDKGTPIVVSYETGHVTGQFLFAQNAKTLEEITAIFSHYKCTVEEVELN